MPSPQPSEQIASSSSTDAPALPEHASPASTGLPNDEHQHLPPGPPTEDLPEKQGRSWIRIVIICLVILSAIAFVVYRIRSNKKAEQRQARGAAAMADRPVPISFDLVKEQPIPIYLTALGTVTAYNTVTLKSRVDGQITRVNFREGEHVSQGQLLIEIDPRPYQATLAQAEGNLVRDQANAANAQAQAQRYNQLYAAGVVSKEQAQTQESTAGQAIGTLAADRAAIQSARVNVNYTRITSPISGLVGLRQVDIGNIVTANSSTGLVVITQVEPIAVIFTVPQDQLPKVFERVRAGRKLMVEAWDRGNLKKLATGSLLTVDNQIDTTTGTAKLKAVFDNHDGALYPNQFVNVRLILENRPRALTIPAAAVQTGTNGSFVYVVDTAHPVSPDETVAAAQASTRNAVAGKSKETPEDSASTESAPVGDISAEARHGNKSTSLKQTSYHVRTRPVSIDLTQGTMVVIQSGLHTGEKVVTDGQEKLKDGSIVIPRPAQHKESDAEGDSTGTP